MRSTRRPGWLISLWLVMLPAAALACGTGSPVTPTTESVQDGLITQDQAIITALQHVTFGGPGVTPMIYLHNPVTELVIYANSGETKPFTEELRPHERFAWIVQVEGEGQSVPMVAGGNVSTYSYAVVFVDAVTNSPFGGTRGFEPYFQ